MLDVGCWMLMCRRANDDDVNKHWCVKEGQAIENEKEIQTWHVSCHTVMLVCLGNRHHNFIIGQHSLFQTPTTFQHGTTTLAIVYNNFRYVTIVPSTKPKYHQRSTRNSSKKALWTSQNVTRMRQDKSIMCWIDPQKFHPNWKLASFLKKKSTK